MKTKLSSTRSDYLWLILGLTIWLFVYKYFEYRPTYQIIMTGLMGGCYVIWGYWHHMRAKTLYAGVIWEYTTFGLLSVALVIGMLGYF